MDFETVIIRLLHRIDAPPAEICRVCGVSGVPRCVEEVESALAFALLKARCGRQ